MSTVSTTDIDYGDNKVSLYISMPLSESSRDYPDSSLQLLRDSSSKNRVQFNPAPYQNGSPHTYWNSNVKIETMLFPYTNQSLGVLSEEQIRLKKMKKLEEEMTRTVRVTSSPLSGWETPRLNMAQLEMIRRLVAAQQQGNKRSLSDRLKVTPWPQSVDSHNREMRQQRFAHFTELAIISVQEIVDFAKQLPGFLDLTREDQIALLKTSTIEIMLLETSRRYDPQMQGITFLPDYSYNREDFARAGLQFEFINPIFEFSKGMNDLHLDDAEYALLIAINLFSADRPNVEDHELVERLQQPYVEALHSYTRRKRPNDHLMFPRMLMKLVCLRTLSSVHSEQVFALRLQDKKLPPLLSEIWDMQE
ncbi:oxysterols receptor LXR-alpha isoform X4 [Scyliorhinus torazame]|uniref:oxysterols receptor LXR-alpha isoform X4 n=1 Tax=Scyliorhinus torazame TaxID=75743 RepID=UPI003B5B1A1B